MGKICKIEEKVIYYLKVYDTHIMNFHAGEMIIRCEGPKRKLVLFCLIIYDGELLRNADYFSFFFIQLPISLENL